MDLDHIHDFDATVFHTQGFDRRLTGVEPARVIKDLLEGRRPGALLQFPLCDRGLIPGVALRR